MGLALFFAGKATTHPRAWRRWVARKVGEPGYFAGGGAVVPVPAGAAFDAGGGPCINIWIARCQSSGGYVNRGMSLQ